MKHRSSKNKRGMRARLRAALPCFFLFSPSHFIFLLRSTTEHMEQVSCKISMLGITISNTLFSSRTPFSVKLVSILCHRYIDYEIC